MKTRTLLIWLVSTLAVVGAAGIFGLNKYADWDYQRTCVEQGRDSSSCYNDRRASWAHKRCEAGEIPNEFVYRVGRAGAHRGCVVAWLARGK